MKRTYKPLTPTMLGLRLVMETHGTLYRHAGGFWTTDAQFQGRSASWGGNTVNALVLRGIAVYSEWRDGRNGRFPVQARLVK